MGRFDSTVPYYARFREPYPPEFFREVAAHLGLNGRQRLIDIGCGPGLLAIGFAPFVTSVTGVDPEAEMIAAARDAARASGVSLELIHAGIEDLEFAAPRFDVATIGRALHWLERDRALPVLERAVVPGGRIAICIAKTSSGDINQWFKKYREIQKPWSADPEMIRYRVTAVEVFAGSRFRKVDEVQVRYQHQITISDLIGRSLSGSITSPAVLGERQPEFEAALAAGLAPYSVEGRLNEEVMAQAEIFA